VARAAPKMTIFSNLTMFPPEGVLLEGGTTGGGDDVGAPPVVEGGGLGGLEDAVGGVAVGVGVETGGGVAVVGAGVEAGGEAVGLGVGAAFGEAEGTGARDPDEGLGAGALVDAFGAGAGALGVADGALGVGAGALAGEPEGPCAQQLPPVRPNMSTTVIIVFNSAIVLR